HGGPRDGRWRLPARPDGPGRRGRPAVGRRRRRGLPRRRRRGQAGRGGRGGAAPVRQAVLVASLPHHRRGPAHRGRLRPASGHSLRTRPWCDDRPHPRGAWDQVSDDKKSMLERLDMFRRFGSTGKIDESLTGEEKTRAEMARNRAINRRQGALSAGGNAAGRSGADISFATGRPRDPLFYWRQNNLPYDFADPDELRKIRLYSRLLYLTHPMVASCV